jgi:hypothetical protein
MSSPLSLEHLAEIRDGARRMVEHTRAHEGDLNHLVETAEGVARHATALAAPTADDTHADGLSRLCFAQARLSTGNGSIPPPLERWFDAIVSKPSPPDVVVAAVQHAVNL